MRFVVGFALLAFGTCQTGTAPTTPPEDAAADTAEPASEDFAAEGEGAGEAEDADAAEGAEAGEAEAAEAGEGEAGEAGEVAAGTSGEPPAEDGGAAPTGDDAGEPDPKSAPAFALPKKVYTKVDAKCGKDKGVGTKLKAFKLATPSGKSVTHRSYGNRVLLVNFWGTWCKPCLKELPEFDRLYRRYRKHGLVAIAIATDEEAEPVQAFVDSRKLSTRVLIGGEDYAGQYGAPTFPFTYVVDAQGVIRAAYHGYKPECMGKLEADIREQLEKRAAKN
jgi:thiol-disulfide isomerase/thioredoxin